MRPVNLIPVEDRRGEHAPLRTGPLAYLVVGGLVMLLAAVTALVLTGNQVSEREEQLARLKSEDASASVKAAQLAAYTKFQELSEERVATVQSLADSRFDWERVMRELSLILPHDVWLTGLSATASSITESGGGAEGGGGALRAGITGPALELTGCAAGQEAVAGFITALKDIDGVTRVGVESSELPDKKSGAGVSPSGEAGAQAGSDCRTREFIAQFSLVVAFDAAPVPSPEEGEAATTAVETASTTSESTEQSSESESSEGSEGE